MMNHPEEHQFGTSWSTSPAGDAVPIQPEQYPHPLSGSFQNWSQDLFSVGGNEIVGWLPAELASSCSAQSGSPMPEPSSPTFLPSPTHYTSPSYHGTPPLTASTCTTLSPNFDPATSPSAFAQAQDAFLTSHSPLESPQFAKHNVPSTPPTSYSLSPYATPPHTHARIYQRSKSFDVALERPPIHRRYTSAPTGQRQVYHPNLSIVVPPLGTSASAGSSSAPSSPALLSPQSPGLMRRPVPRRSRFLPLEDYAPTSTFVERAFETPSVLGSPFVQSPPPSAAYPTPTHSSPSTFPSFSAYLDESASPVTPSRKDSTSSSTSYGFPIPTLTITRPAPLSQPEPYIPPSPPTSPSLGEFSPAQVSQRPIIAGPGVTRPFPSVLAAPTSSTWSSSHPGYSEEQDAPKPKKVTPKKKKASAPKTRNPSVQQVGRLKFVNLDSTDAHRLTHAVARSGVQRKKKSEAMEL